MSLHYDVKCRTCSSYFHNISFPPQTRWFLKIANCYVVDNLNCRQATSHLPHWQRLPVFFASDQSHPPPCCLAFRTSHDKLLPQLIHNVHAVVLCSSMVIHCWLVTSHRTETRQYHKWYAGALSCGKQTRLEQCCKITEGSSCIGNRFWKYLEKSSSLWAHSHGEQCFTNKKWTQFHALRTYPAAAANAQDNYC